MLTSLPVLLQSKCACIKDTNSVLQHPTPLSLGGVNDSKTCRSLYQTKFGRSSLNGKCSTCLAAGAPP